MLLASPTSTDTDTDTQDDTPATDHDRLRLLLELGTAMQAAGAPAHHVELSLEAVARRLGLATPEIYATPTALFLGDGHTTQLRRVRAEQLDIGRLARLDELVGTLLASPLDAGRLREALDSLRAPSPACPRALARAIVALLPATFAVLLGGGLVEAIASAAIGLVVAELAGALAQSRSAPATELAGATLAATLAGLVAAHVPGVSGFRVALAGLVALLPGFALTLGMTELASRHLVAGASRLVGAMSVLFQLVFGVAIALALLGPTVLTVSLGPAASLPLAFEAALLAVALISLGALFGARARDLGWIALTGGVAWFAARGAAAWLGPSLAGFGGALAMGLVANTLARWRTATRRIPAPTALLVPGMMLLVPGSVGLRGFAALLGQDVTGGIQGVFAMGLAAAGIAAGLFVANALVDARRHLREAARTGQVPAAGATEVRALRVS